MCGRQHCLFCNIISSRCTFQLKGNILPYSSTEVAMYNLYHVLARAENRTFICRREVQK